MLEVAKVRGNLLNSYRMPFTIQSSSDALPLLSSQPMWCLYSDADFLDETQGLRKLTLCTQADKQYRCWTLKLLLLTMGPRFIRQKEKLFHVPPLLRHYSFPPFISNLKSKSIL